MENNAARTIFKGDRGDEIPERGQQAAVGDRALGTRKSAASANRRSVQISETTKHRPATREVLFKDDPSMMRDIEGLRQQSGQRVTSVDRRSIQELPNFDIEGLFLGKIAKKQVPETIPEEEPLQRQSGGGDFTKMEEEDIDPQPQPVRHTNPPTTQSRREPSRSGAPRKNISFRERFSLSQNLRRRYLCVLCTGLICLMIGIIILGFLVQPDGPTERETGWQELLNSTDEASESDVTTALTSAAVSELPHEGDLTEDTIAHDDVGHPDNPSGDDLPSRAPREQETPADKNEHATGEIINEGEQQHEAGNQTMSGADKTNDRKK